VEGEFEVRRNGELMTVLTPQKRVYRVQTSPMTEAAIDGGLHRDLFLALGDSVGGGAWSVRVQFKPLVRFLWLGAIIMACGGLLAATDRRYRVAADRRSVPSGAVASNLAGS
jgi:cytochrome c-type biogenesis protein CcmF